MALARSEFEYEYEDEFEGEEFLGGLANIAGSLLGEGEEEFEFEDEFEGEGELEYEFEDELEDEYEDEYEFEDEYELEDEYEDEYEGEFEDEYETEDEAFLGGLANIASSLLGEGEFEDEDEAEYFFGKIGRFFKRNAPIFKKIAKIAAPMIATAVGGPAAGAVARAVTSQLEGEYEDELEAELEDMATAPLTPGAALGEYLAARAATAQSEAEAEAFIGSAVTTTLSRRDRREMEELLPHLLRGAHVLTRILHRNPATRPAVRFVPGIVDSTAKTLAARVGSGQPINPADIGAVMGSSTRRVLGDPRWTTAVARRHARGLAVTRRRRYHHVMRHATNGPVLISPRHGHHHRHHPRGVRRVPGYTPRGYYRPGTLHPRGGAIRPVHHRPGIPTHRRGGSTIHRHPVHGRPIPGVRTHHAPPRGRTLRVVTPVKVPSRHGGPPRVVKVVTNVKVPRGAVPAGRPAARVARRGR